MSKLLKKHGNHGTLYSFAMRYVDDGDEGCPVFTLNVWAYDKDHATERFHDAPDGDGWRILSAKKRRAA